VLTHLSKDAAVITCITSKQERVEAEWGDIYVVAQGLDKIKAIKKIFFQRSKHDQSEDETVHAAAADLAALNKLRLKISPRHHATE